MARLSLEPYERVAFHEAVAALIRRRSTNAEDVREVALKGLDLESATRVLDLGCGFGFMTEAVAPRVAADALVLGVDVWCSNEAPFLERVQARGRRAAFECRRLERELPWPDRSFDLIVCSYSLYFFPGAIPEIARVLAPDGLFVALTHSEQHVADELLEGGFEEAARNLVGLIRTFSAENGETLLRRSFGDVERIEFRNALRFSPGDLEDLLAYMRFKLPLLAPERCEEEGLPETLAAFARSLLRKRGEVVLAKNDVVFRCRRPSCR